MRREPGAVSLVRKPALLLFALGCAVSALASGRLSLRLIADGALSFIFVPLIEMAALALVSRTRIRKHLPFPLSVDLFFSGNAPWLMLIGTAAALGCIVPSRETAIWFRLVLFGSFVAAAWSAYIDYQFYRQVMDRKAGGAVRDLVLQRAISWTAATAYFFGIAIWSEILPKIYAMVGL